MLDNEKKSEWKQVENKLLGNNAVVESVNGDHMTVCRYKINKAVSILAHSHDYEQTVYVVQGEMNLMVGSRKVPMKTGDIQVILGNVEHSAEIFGIPFESIESYCPVRADLVNK